MKNDQPKPPTHLSREAKRWWKKLTAEFVFETPDAVLLLQTTFEAYDRMVEAQVTIKKDGTLLLDRFQQKKMHPAVLIERDARQAVLRGLKQLGLDVVPPGAIGRPPGR